MQPDAALPPPPPPRFRAAGTRSGDQFWRDPGLGPTGPRSTDDNVHLRKWQWLCQLENSSQIVMTKATRPPVTSCLSQFRAHFAWYVLNGGRPPDPGAGVTVYISNLEITW